MDGDRRSNPSALPASRVPGLAARRRRDVLARTADAPRSPHPRRGTIECQKLGWNSSPHGRSAGRRTTPEAGGVVQDAGREIGESGGMTPRFLPVPWQDSNLHPAVKEMAQLRRCARARICCSVATAERELSCRQIFHSCHAIQRERPQPLPGMFTPAPSVYGRSGFAHCRLVSHSLGAVGGLRAESSATVCGGRGIGGCSGKAPSVKTSIGDGSRSTGGGPRRG